jgi:hypothetical protein
MKADTEEKVKDAEDDFWKIHIPFFTAQFSTYYTKPQKICGRFHISDEKYRAKSHEIVPVKEKRGSRTYVMMQPYVREQIWLMSVELYNKPKKYADQESAIGKTIGQPKQQGFRDVQVGNGQAWYYHEDKTIVLWECFFMTGFADPHSTKTEISCICGNPLNTG